MTQEAKNPPCGAAHQGVAMGVALAAAARKKRDAANGGQGGPSGAIDGTRTVYAHRAATDAVRERLP